MARPEERFDGTLDGMTRREVLARGLVLGGGLALAGTLGLGESFQPAKAAGKGLKIFMVPKWTHHLRRGRCNANLLIVMAFLFFLQGRIKQCPGLGWQRASVAAVQQTPSL